MLVVNVNSVIASFSFITLFAFDYYYGLRAIRNVHSFILIHLYIYRRDWQTRAQGQIWPVAWFCIVSVLKMFFPFLKNCF